MNDPQAADRNAYVEKRLTELDELSAHIDELERRLKKEDTDAWIKTLTHFEGLKEQHNDLRQRVERVHETPHHVWDETRHDIEHAWSRFEKALADARRRVESRPK